MKNPAFVINPHAGRGSARKTWTRLEPLARKRFGPIRMYITKGPGDAQKATEKALINGAQSLVCLGGDGTLNEVINALFSLSRSPADLPVGFIPNGTGCDLIKTIPIPRDARAAFDLLATGRKQPVDIGRITRLDKTGQRRCIYFHNVVSFGIGGEVAARVNRSHKRFGPLLSFLLATSVTLFLSKAKPLRVCLDSGEEQDFKVLNLAVANGQYHGGGMWVAPGARVDDGLFQVVVIKELGLCRILQHLPKLYNGRIGDVPGVTTFAARTIAAGSTAQVLLEVDGEQNGELPVSIDILPKALTLITP